MPAYRPNTRSFRSYKMQTIDDVDDVIDGEVVSESWASREEDGVSGWVEDLFSAGQKVVSGGAKAGSGAASDAVEKALRSSEFNKLLVAVEDKAREGVKKEVASNLPTLAMFTLAGGALGGVIAQVGGKAGTAVVVGLALYLGFNLVNKK